MSDIFICYAREDAAIATQLAKQFEAEGWSAFYDTQTPIGHFYPQEIEKQLDAARAVVVLWSTHSINSNYVQEEAQHGIDKSILFPAFIENVKLPYGFRRIQTADLVGWEGHESHSGLEALLNSLRLHLNGQTRRPAPIIRPEPAPQPVPSSPAFPSPGQTFRDKLKIGGEGPLMVVIPAGRFLMGSPPDEPERKDNEGPRHEVRIGKPFAMSVYAVTFDDYDRFCNSTQKEKSDDSKWGRGKRPVINVSWQNAQAYCAWLSEQTGRRYRLPSEAEWEYACRAGTETPFYTGERIATDQANFDGNYIYNGSAEGVYRQQTVPVGSFPPNAFGLYEMHGNVWEWCQDRWHKNYQDAPLNGAPWERGGGFWSNLFEFRVLRGGSWLLRPGHVRSAARSFGHPVDRYVIVGFRVLCSSPIDE